MKPPFRLAQRRSSGDVSAALAILHKQAADGELIGIAFTAMYSQRTYFVDVVGEARRSPTFTLGMIGALFDHVVNLTKTAR